MNNSKRLIIQIRPQPAGAISLLVLLGVSVFSLMVLVSLNVISSQAFSMVLDQAATERVFYAAEAGLNEGLYRLVGSPAPQSFNFNFNNAAVEVVISVNPSNPYQRLITSRAADTGGKVRELEVIANTSAFAGGFIGAVHAGAGGVYINNNATVIGDVYSNGNVTGGSNGVIQGKVSAVATASQHQTHDNSDSEFIFGQSSTYSDVAQSFTPSLSGQINQIRVKLRSIGNPNLNNTWWRLTSDNNGKPATVALTSGAFSNASVGRVSQTLAWLIINIPTPVSVAAGTKYWLVIDAANNASNYWAWSKDSADTYSGGSAFYTNNWSSPSAIWTPLEADGADLSFQIWFGGAYVKLENIIVRGEARANRITGTGGSSYAKVCHNAYYDSILTSSYDFLSSTSNQYNNLRDSTCGSSAVVKDFSLDDNDRLIYPLPITDQHIQIWQEEIAVSGQTELNPNPADCPQSYNSGTYCVTSSTTLGNQKINGDLYVGVKTTSGDEPTLILSGNVWVTGKIILNNGGVIRLDPNLEAASSVLIADGTVILENNYQINGSGNPKSFLLLATRNSSLGGTPAISTSNNSSSLVVAAPNGEVLVKQGGVAKAAAAYQLTLENGSQVVFDNNLKDLFVPSSNQSALGTEVNSWQEK